MITNGKVVNLSYSLTNSKGQVLDRADTQEPFTYLHGGGQIVPGLESALEGCKVGDRKNVTVAPADGYGELNPELKLQVKKTQFPGGVEIEPGMQFETRAADGNGIVFTVESILGDDVTIDGNHPLAGQTLNFDVEVLAVRDATAEELDHGHAHGADGHGHDEHDHHHDHGGEGEPQGE